MPALDKIHAAVRNALIKDGWTITHDPFTIQYKDVELFADLGAERPLAAERREQRIVVEIKSFLGPSLQRDWQSALGQYVIYRDLLAVLAPERELFLAVSGAVQIGFFERESVQLVVQNNRIKLVVVDLDTEEILRWIN
jgi:hypothetical protein